MTSKRHAKGEKLMMLLLAAAWEQGQDGYIGTGFSKRGIHVFVMYVLCLSLAVCPSDELVLRRDLAELNM